MYVYNKIENLVKKSYLLSFRSLIDLGEIIIIDALR